MINGLSDSFRMKDQLWRCKWCGRARALLPLFRHDLLGIKPDRRTASEKYPFVSCLRVDPAHLGQDGVALQPSAEMGDHFFTRHQDARPWLVVVEHRLEQRYSRSVKPTDETDLRYGQARETHVHDRDTKSQICDVLAF